MRRRKRRRRRRRKMLMKLIWSFFYYPLTLVLSPLSVLYHQHLEISDYHCPVVSLIALQLQTYSPTIQSFLLRLQTSVAEVSWRKEVSPYHSLVRAQSCWREHYRRLWSPRLPCSMPHGRQRGHGCKLESLSGSAPWPSLCANETIFFLVVYYFPQNALQRRWSFNSSLEICLYFTCR